MRVHGFLNEELVNRVGIIANVVAGFLLTPQLVGLERLYRYSESLKTRSKTLAHLLSSVYPTPFKAFGILLALFFMGYGMFLFLQLVHIMTHVTHLSAFGSAFATFYVACLLVFAIFAAGLFYQWIFQPINETTAKWLEEPKRPLVVLLIAVQFLWKAVLFGILLPAALYSILRLFQSIPWIISLLGCLTLALYLGYWRLVAVMQELHIVALLVLPRYMFRKQASYSVPSRLHYYAEKITVAAQVIAVATFGSLTAITLFPFIMVWQQGESLVKTRRLNRRTWPFRDDGRLPSVGLCIAIVFGPILYLPVKWLSKLLSATSSHLERKESLLGALTFLGIVMFLLGNVLQYWATFHPKIRF